jgi:hypothetical protein
MSKQRLKVWPVRAYGAEAPKAALQASMSGNAKQRRRGRRILQRAGYSLTHDGGAGRVIARPK